MAADSDFKFGAQLGFAKAWGSISIFTQWLKLATSNLVRRLDLPIPIIKSHPEEKVWVALG